MSSVRLANDGGGRVTVRGQVRICGIFLGLDR